MLRYIACTTWVSWTNDPTPRQMSTRFHRSTYSADSEALKMNWFTAERMDRKSMTNQHRKYEYKAIFLVPNCTCRPSINSRHFMASEQPLTKTALSVTYTHGDTTTQLITQLTSIRCCKYLAMPRNDVFWSSLSTPLGAMDNLLRIPTLEFPHYGIQWLN